MMPIQLILKKNVDKVIAVDIAAPGRRRIPKQMDKELILIKPSGKIAALM